jgi:Pectate lyase superfamily protein
MSLRFGAILVMCAAIAAAQNDGGPDTSSDIRGQVNVKATGAKGDGKTDDTASIQKAFDTAVRKKVGVYFPAGEYLVSSSVQVLCNVTLEKNTTVRATTAMPAVFSIGSASAVVDGSLSGGTIDANNMASDGIWVHQFQHYDVEQAAVLNALSNGFHIGDPGKKGGYEFTATKLRTRRTSGKLRPGSTGLLIEPNATDNNIAQSVFVGSDIGIKVLSGGNFFSDIHVWSPPSAGWMSVGFEDDAIGNFWRGCEADTTSIGLHATKFNTVINGCRFYNNNTYGSDNKMVGISFDKPMPYATIQATLFVGADASHRLALDYTASPSGVSVMGVQRQNVAAQAGSASAGGHSSP